MPDLDIPPPPDQPADAIVAALRLLGPRVHFGLSDHFVRPTAAKDLTMRCSQRLPDVRPKFQMTTPFLFDLRSLSVGVADLVLVRAENVSN